MQHRTKQPTRIEFISLPSWVFHFGARFTRLLLSNKRWVLFVIYRIANIIDCICDFELEPRLIL